MKKVVIVGSGRSGRGMLGELYARDHLFQITFADCDLALLDTMRKQLYYTVNMVNLETNIAVEKKIENFEVVDVNDKNIYINVLNQADIISLAILPKDFDEVLHDLVLAIQYRYKNQAFYHEKMIITLGANYVGMKQYFYTGIEHALTADEFDYFKQNVVLLMSIVNRKNLLPKDDEKTEDKLRIVGDDKDILQIEDSEVLQQLGEVPTWMVRKHDVEALMAVKIWAYNLVQGCMAAIGMSKGLMDTYACANDYETSMWSYYASLEGYAAVQKEFKLPDRSEKESKYTVEIFKNEHFKDDCFRIIRNPVRKLRRNERFIGPALCALKHHILPYYIAKCCAYMFLYEHPNDEDSIQMQKNIREFGIEYVIRQYCELNLEDENENLLFQLILKSYKSITEHPLGLKKVNLKLETCIL